MVSPLDFVLAGIAAIVLVWGFERYRTHFERVELAIAVVSATGLITLAFVPIAFDYLGELLNIQRRPFVVGFLANVTLLAVVLYVTTSLRETRRDLSELTRRLSLSDAPKTDGGRDSVHVVIPAYNEASTIREVIAALPSAVLGHEVVPVVVSDGSEDDTVERATTNRAVVVEHYVQQGQGGALKTGFEYADRHGASVVVTMDADGQHPPEDIERFVAPIVNDRADFVVGSRHTGVDRSGNSSIRRIGIHWFTWLINALTKSKFTDCTNGYRAIRGQELSRLTLTEERFSAPELLIEARKHDLRIEEVPVTVEQRGAGVSKKPKLGYAVGLTRTIIVTWLR